MCIPLFPIVHEHLWNQEFMNFFKTSNVIASSYGNVYFIFQFNILTRNVEISEWQDKIKHASMTEYTTIKSPALES